MDYFLICLLTYHFLDVASFDALFRIAVSLPPIHDPTLHALLVFLQVLYYILYIYTFVFFLMSLECKILKAEILVVFAY